MANDMLTEIRKKIRALVPDLIKQEPETFIYKSGDTVFTLAEPNIASIISVKKNGIELGTGDYSYDSTTGELEITVSLSANDIIEVKYTFTKYSNSELDEYIRASLVFISTYSHCETDYELEDDEIVPTPDNKTTDLIALVSSILIQPEYTSYRLPNITVTYTNRLSKEEKIRMLILRFYAGIGIDGVLEFN